MAKLSAAMERLKVGLRVLKWWTVIVMVVLVGVVGVVLVVPWVLPEPNVVVLAGGYLVVTAVFFVIHWMTKDNQRQIMLGLIRGLLGVILPVVFMIPGLVYTIWVMLIGFLFFVVGLVVFYLVFAPIYAMLQGQRELKAAMTTS
jgi:hypothetical protein